MLVRRSLTYITIKIVIIINLYILFTCTHFGKVKCNKVILEPVQDLKLSLLLNPSNSSRVVLSNSVE